MAHPAPAALGRGVNPLSRFEIVALGAMLAFLGVAILTGGGSRPDIQSHVILRPLSVLAGAGACLFLSRGMIREIRMPLILLGALAALMLIQLIPLPPSIWTSLPGRGLYAEGAAVMGIEQPWRPITLSPARTWNSFVSLLPPAAALLLFALLSHRGRDRILTALLILLGASAALGLAQVAGPPGGPLYLYAVTNEASAVGFFSNRNHQALMLACLFPMLAAYALLPAASGERRPHRLWIAGAAAITLIPFVLATGSRSGALLSLVGLVFAGLLFLTAPKRGGPRASRGRRALIWGISGTAIAFMVAMTLFFSRADSLYRIASVELAGDLRVRLLQPLLDMISSSFPVGIGFGAFDPVFRAIEPDALLRRSYANNAHNDLLQLVLEGGLPAVLLLVALLGWLARHSYRIWFRERPEPPILLARLGSLVSAMILLGSVADYPLRTPFVMIVFAISLAWLGGGRSRLPAPPPRDEVSAR